MAKLTFPSITVWANKGNVARIRQTLTEWAEYLRKSPGGKPDFAAHVSAFINQAGLTFSPLSTQIVVSSGVKVLGPAITGSYVNGYTLTIVGGVVTAIVAS